MDESDDPRELERKIEQERLRAWIEDLRQRLRQRLEARRTKQAISARAHELWELHGRPSGRDLEFWLQAESEISERHPQ
jgi:hypothetical protein